VLPYHLVSLGIASLRAHLTYQLGRCGIIIRVEVLTSLKGGCEACKREVGSWGWFRC
jgi:hypothetical protein